MRPAYHDRILAYTSHLPHVIAFALMDTLPSAYLLYSPRSLRDMTRIAASSPELWDDICMVNRANLSLSIKAFMVNMKKISTALLRGDNRTLRHIMKRAQDKRKRLQ